MKPLAIGLAAWAALTLGGQAIAQENPGVGVFGVKYPVSDFARSVAYYSTYFPLRQDKVHNAYEMALASTEPGSTQRPLTLWLDRCATPKGRAQMAKARDFNDKVHADLTRCTTKFRAGSSWLFIMVSDAAKIAAQLTADGHKATLKRLPATGPGYLLVFTHDPDGNVVEAVQMVGK